MTGGLERSHRPSWRLPSYRAVSADLLARTARPEAARRQLQGPRARTELRRFGFTKRALASRIFSRRNISARTGLNLSSRMGSSVPSRSCPPRIPRGAWPASSRWQFGEALSGLVGRERLLAWSHTSQIRLHLRDRA